MDEQRIDTEKITVNLTPVDLGKIDLVVSQGIFSTRTDFIRTAIRRELEQHDPLIQDVVRRHYWSVGAEWITKADLENKRAANERIRIRVVGLLTLAKDVTPELADDVIEDISVLGSFRAPKPVRARLAPKMSGTKRAR